MAKTKPIQGLSPDDAGRMLAANTINLAKKLGAGGTLSTREMDLLEKVQRGPDKGTDFGPGDIVAGMNQAAAVLGINREVVREAKRSGCLAFRANNNVHVPTLRKWLAENEVGRADELESKASSEKRTSTAKADHWQLRVQERRKELIPAAVMRRAFTRAVIAFTTRLLVIPDNAAQRLAVTSDPIEIREALRVMIHEALDELSKCEWAKEAGDETQKIKTT